MNAIETDVLIVGGGAAGLVTALNATPRRVTLIVPTSSDRPAETASELAQGGIAAAVGAGDSPSLHLEDTVRAGAGLVQIGAARYLCERAAPI
jgi:L-aspartate oxidase